MIKYMNLKELIGFGFIIILINILITFCFCEIIYNRRKRFAVIDFEGIKTRYLQTLLYQKDSEREKSIQNFVQKINKLVIQVSHDNDLILLPKQVVFGGEDLDLTKDLERVLLHE